MENWKIVAFTGAIIFLISGFLPLISSSLFDFSFWFSLMNVYTSLGQTVESSAGSVSISAGAIGILLTIISYPITVILGFVSIARRRIALAAGILGIICWIGAMLAINEVLSDIPDLSGSPLQYVGLSAYIGFIGSIILIVASALKPRGITPQAVAPPAPPPPAPP